MRPPRPKRLSPSPTLPDLKNASHMPRLCGNTWVVVRTGGAAPAAAAQAAP